MPESLAPNLTHWNARLEAALEIIRAAAQRSPAVAEACDIIEEALYYIRQAAPAGDRSAGADALSPPELRAAPASAARNTEADVRSPASPGGLDRDSRSDNGAPRNTEADVRPAGAARICADVLENDFVLGEVETVQEAVEMAVATFGRDAVAEYCGVRPQEIAKAEKGLRVKKVYDAIAPLMPKTWTDRNEEEE